MKVEFDDNNPDDDEMESYSRIRDTFRERQARSAAAPPVVSDTPVAHVTHNDPSPIDETVGDDPSPIDETVGASSEEEKKSTIGFSNH